jgi:hypothetical protein
VLKRVVHCTWSWNTNSNHTFARTVSKINFYINTFSESLESALQVTLQQKRELLCYKCEKRRHMCVLMPSEWRNDRFLCVGMWRWLWMRGVQLRFEPDISRLKPGCITAWAKAICSLIIIIIIIIIIINNNNHAHRVFKKGKLVSLAEFSGWYQHRNIRAWTGENIQMLWDWGNLRYTTSINERKVEEGIQQEMKNDT